MKQQTRQVAVAHEARRQPMAVTPEIKHVGVPLGFEKVLPNLFFFLFVAQIFSPYIGVTLYLEVFVALIDPKFYMWMAKRSFPPAAIISLLLLVTVTAFSGFADAAGVLALVVTVSYLFYALNEGVFYFYRYFSLSTLIGVAQYIGVSYGYSWAFDLGPTNLSRLVWGELATPTYTNFFEMYAGQLRVSGLSRESGFFASLAVVAFMLLLVYPPLRTRWRWLIVAVALLISFSKMTIVLPFLILVWIFRRNVDWIPNAIITLVWIIVGYVSAYLLWERMLESEIASTLVYRFGGYVLLGKMSVGDLVLGVDSVYDIGEFSIVQQYVGASHYTIVAGFPAIVIHFGVFALIAWLLAIGSVGIRASGVVVLLISTVNQDPLTNQNFVSLAYLVVLIAGQQVQSIADRSGRRSDRAVVESR